MTSPLNSFLATSLQPQWNWSRQTRACSPLPWSPWSLPGTFDRFYTRCVLYENQSPIKNRPLNFPQVIPKATARLGWPCSPSAVKSQSEKVTLLIVLPTNCSSPMNPNNPPISVDSFSVLLINSTGCHAYICGSVPLAESGGWPASSSLCLVPYTSPPPSGINCQTSS